MKSTKKLAYSNPRIHAIAYVIEQFGQIVIFCNQVLEYLHHVVPKRVSPPGRVAERLFTVPLREPVNIGKKINFVLRVDEAALVDTMQENVSKALTLFADHVRKCREDDAV